MGQNRSGVKLNTRSTNATPENRNGNWWEESFSEGRGSYGSTSTVREYYIKSREVRHPE